VAAREIEIPDFDFSGFYYAEILTSLILFQRVNVPEITEENENEPFQQLLRAFALTGHLNNVLLDVTATETLLPTARLLESVRSHLALIDVTLRQATPAQTDLILQFSKIFQITTNVVAQDSQFATEETEESPQIVFENADSITISPTNAPSAVFSFEAGKIKILDNAFEAGDKVTIDTIDFRNTIEWVVGGTIPITLDNITTAINTSTAETIFTRMFAVNDGVDTISLIPIDQTILSIVVAETDGATDNFEVSSAAFGANKTGLASTDALFFDLFDSTPKQGDVVYIGHDEIMWDTIEWVFDTVASGIIGVFEFYDGNLSDKKPNTVTNLGSQLEFDLTLLLGALDRSNTVVRVVLIETGAEETLLSEFVGGKNIITTVGLLGQTSVSTDEQAYVVGTLWNEVSDLDDGSTGLTEDGKTTYTLPQNVTQDWISTVINNFDSFWMRFRVISVAAPVNPSVDRIRIDTGNQFLKFVISQGETVVENPLGSSNGNIDQEFTLTFRPTIEGTLTIEINEGAGFQEWNSVENFLNSTSVSKDYVLEIKGDDTAIVKFGDGIRGKIPTTGIDNIRSFYRVGADIDGNVGSGTIKVNKSGVSFVSRLFNPRAAIGFNVKEGSTDEDLARLKIEGPATLRTRGRGITTDDMEFLATQFISSTGSKIVSRALAIEETFGVKTIELVVVGQAGALLTEAQRDELSDFFNGNKAAGIPPVLLANHELTPVNYTPKIIDVDVDVTGGNSEEIKNAIVALLNPEATFDDGVTKRWAFGQEVPTSVIIAEIFEVDPVNIKKVELTTPAADVLLASRELPIAGVVVVTVV